MRQAGALTPGRSAISVCRTPGSACGGLCHTGRSQGRGEPGLSKDSLKNAQMTGPISGGTATLDARIWVNLMPSLEARSSAVRIAARLLISGGHRGGISVSRLWFVPSNGQPVEASIADSQVTPEGVRFTGGVALTRDLGARGWVVAEIKDSASSLFIRSTETNIQKVH